jgi:CheY-like chemotaxis protein
VYLHSSANLRLQRHEDGRESGFLDSLAARRVEWHHSKVGRGTRFQVSLPVLKPADADKGVRELAESALGRSGLSILLAKDGSEGLELFRQHADEIQVVLLDRTMPGIDGDAVFEEIRRLPSQTLRPRRATRRGPPRDRGQCRRASQSLT